MDKQIETLWSGHYMSVLARNGWEYTTRPKGLPAVGVVAVTDDNKVVLVEQYRAPVNRHVVELPAGLSGDLEGSEDEPLLEAARRELHEETGYTADRWTELVRGYSSPGLTDESIVLFLAEGLTKTDPGGGDATEAITVHELPFENVLSWLTANGHVADLKLLAGLYAAQQHRARRER